MGKNQSLPYIQLSRKPTYVKVGDNVDFYRLFQVIEQKFETCFILESLVSESHQSRYSVIGFDPTHTILAKDHLLYFDNRGYIVDNPYFSLQNIVPQNVISRSYAGGLIGYLSYDAVSYFEPSLHVSKHPSFPQFRFGVYLDGLVLDKLTGELFYFFYDKNRSSLVKRLLTEVPFSGIFSASYIGQTMSKSEHKKRVFLIKEEIRRGNTFQCQLGFKKEYEVRGNTLQIYTALRKINPSPYMYYLKFGKEKIVGASPELLFQLKNGEMETFPLAGTTSRGKNEREDQDLARKLLHDPKEVAEHNMLVDLHRNDIGRVSRFGTVKVRTLMDIKKFSHVQHISSEIVGIMNRNNDMFSSLASNFPAGTLSGAPKIESMRIIEKTEGLPRGPYGGAVGHFGFNGDCTFTIPIRTLFVSGVYAYTQASGGIVYDSTPEHEYQEVLHKMKAVERALDI